MGADGDRRERAGNFVRGLMDEAERERAQRDLEIDPQFREAVLDAVGHVRADEQRPRDEKPADAPLSDAPLSDAWSDIAARLTALPQMQAKADTSPRAPTGPGEPRVTFGRRKTDFMPRPQPAQPPRRPAMAGVASASLWRAAVLALAVTCAFLLGYVAGVHSGSGPAVVPVTTER